MKPRTPPRANGSNLRLAADIGGTFTDIAVFDDRTGKLSFGKALSTPQRLVDGINAGVEKAGSDYRSAGLFLHGSTIAINTILERSGAKTALLVTEGFRGGGGYGSPLERPIDEVREDVRLGYVTVECAAELYGVVLDPETFEVDVPATGRLRAARAVTGGGDDLKSA